MCTNMQVSSHICTQEDQLLQQIVSSMADLKWKEVARQMRSRNHKQCRERYCNHLDPTLSFEDFVEEDDTKLFQVR